MMKLGNYILGDSTTHPDLQGMRGCVVGVIKVNDDNDTAFVVLPHRLPGRWMPQQDLRPLPERKGSDQ